MSREEARPHTRVCGTYNSRYRHPNVHGAIICELYMETHAYTHGRNELATGESAAAGDRRPPQVLLVVPHLV